MVVTQVLGWVGGQNRQTGSTTKGMTNSMCNPSNKREKPASHSGMYIAGEKSV